MKIYDYCETGVNIAGIAVSVGDLNQVLNMVVLIISVCSLLFRACWKIYQLVKENRFEEVGDALDETKDQLTQIANQTKGDTDERNQGSDRKDQGD